VWFFASSFVALLALLTSLRLLLSEIRTSVEADHDPIATARKARKERIEKNTRQAARNAADALAANSTSTSNATSSTRPGVSTLSQAQKKTLREARKEELDRSMALSRTATASMGKFDKKIEGEPKIKGVKRKVSVGLRRC
jgi:regulator of ribosome biosynthesis